MVADNEGPRLRVIQGKIASQRRRAQRGLSKASCPDCKAAGLDHSWGMAVATDLLTDGRRLRRTPDEHTIYLCPFCLAKGKVQPLQ